MMNDGSVHCCMNDKCNDRCDEFIHSFQIITHNPSKRVIVVYLLQ